MKKIKNKFLICVLSLSLFSSQSINVNAQESSNIFGSMVGGISSGLLKEEIAKKGVVYHVFMMTAVVSLFNEAYKSLRSFSSNQGWIEDPRDKYLIKQLLDNLTKVSPEDATHRRDLIFNLDTKKELNALVQQMIKRARKKKSLFNVLLHGPSGTGKTATVKAFVHEGFDVWVLAGQKIIRPSQFNHLTKWLAKRKKTSSKPLILLVDEAEVLFKQLNASRSNELVNSFLTELGSPSASVSWWFTANSTMDLWLAADKAIERRFSYKKLVDLPNALSRRIIFQNAFNDMIMLFKEQKVAISIKEIFADKDTLHKFTLYTKGYSADDMSHLGKHFANLIFNKRNKRDIVASLMRTLRKEEEDKKSMEAAAREDYEKQINRLKRKAEMQQLMQQAYDDDLLEEEEEEEEEEDSKKNKKSRRRRR